MRIIIPGFRSASKGFNKYIKEQFGKRNNQKDTQNVKVANPKGSQGGEAACCSITSLDELANAANQGSNFSGEENTNQMSDMGTNTHQSGTPHEGGHNTLHNPFDSTKLEMALTPFVSVLGVAGVYIGYSIYKDFNDKKISLEGALQKLDRILEDKEYDGKKLNLTAEQTQTYQAYSTVVKEQYDEADFQQFWAGKLSSFTSGGIVAGQFIMPLGVASLLALGGIGAAHTTHMARNISQSNDKIRRAQEVIKESNTIDSDSNEQELDAIELKQQDAIIREDYFKHRRNHEIRNMVAWAGFTAGAGTLGVAQAIALANGVGVATEPAVAGISALGAGVAGTVVENNILTSSRFVTAMPIHAWKRMSELGLNDNQQQWYGADDQSHKGQTLSEQDVHKANIAASQKLQLAKEYRKEFFESRSISQKFIHAAQRGRQKVLAYGTLGLVKHFTSQMKFNDKVRVSKQNSPEMDDARIELLKHFGEIDNDKNVNDKTQESDCGNENKNKLQSLIDTIIDSGQEDGIAKMIAQKIMKDSETIKHGYQDLFNTTSGNVEFDNFNAESPEDRVMAFKTIKETPACCSSAYESQGIFEYIQKVYAVPESNNTLSSKEKMYDLVREATDHFLLYQSKKSAHEHVAIWSNLSDAYQRATPAPDKVLQQEMNKTPIHLSTISDTSDAVGENKCSKVIPSEMLSKGEDEFPFDEVRQDITNTARRRTAIITKAEELMEAPIDEIMGGGKAFSMAKRHPDETVEASTIRAIEENAQKVYLTPEVSDSFDKWRSSVQRTKPADQLAM